MKFKFCPECGYKFEKEHKFCPECGLRLDQADAPQKVNDSASDFLDIENLFDAQISKKEQAEKDYQNKLTAAKVLILKEQYEKAEEAYNEILEDAIDDIVPNIGLIRAVSKNFTVLDEKRVNEQMELLFELFDKEECLKADEDFKNFYEEREFHFLELEELEKERIRAEKEEQKRKEEQLARIKREQEEKERQLQLAKEREEKERLKFIERYNLAQERASQVLDMTRVLNTIYFGVYPEGKQIAWDIIHEDDNVICILTTGSCARTTYYITNDIFYGNKKGVFAELDAFRSLFNEKQKSVLCAYEFIDGGKIAKEEKIRLLNTYEFLTWKNKIFSGPDFWVKRLNYIPIQPYHWRGKDDKFSYKPFLYVSCGKLEFENKMSAVCGVRPMAIIDKKKLISVVGVN